MTEKVGSVYQRKPYFVFVILLKGGSEVDKVGKSWLSSKYRGVPHNNVEGKFYDSHFIDYKGYYIEVRISDYTPPPSGTSYRHWRAGNGIMLVFDLSNQDSFDMINDYLEDSFRGCITSAVKLLIGNKSDKKDTIDRDQIHRYASKHGLKYMETSAETGDGVNKAFEYLLDRMIEKNLKKGLEEEEKDDPVNMEQNEVVGKKEKKKALACSFV